MDDDEDFYQKLNETPQNRRALSREIGSLINLIAQIIKESKNKSILKEAELFLDFSEKVNKVTPQAKIKIFFKEYENIRPKIMGNDQDFDWPKKQDLEIDIAGKVKISFGIIEKCSNYFDKSEIFDRKYLMIYKSFLNIYYIISKMEEDSEYESVLENCLENVNDKLGIGTNSSSSDFFGSFIGKFLTEENKKKMNEVLANIDFSEITSNFMGENMNITEIANKLSEGFQRDGASFDPSPLLESLPEETRNNFKKIITNATKSFAGGEEIQTITNGDKEEKENKKDKENEEDKGHKEDKERKDAREARETRESKESSENKNNKNEKNERKK